SPPAPRRGDEGGAGVEESGTAGTAGPARDASGRRAGDAGAAGAAAPHWRAVPARSLAALTASWAPVPAAPAPTWAGPRWKAAPVSGAPTGGVIPFAGLVAFSFVMLLAPQA